MVNSLFELFELFKNLHVIWQAANSLNGEAGLFDSPMLVAVEGPIATLLGAAAASAG